MKAEKNRKYGTVFVLVFLAAFLCSLEIGGAETIQHEALVEPPDFEGLAKLDLKKVKDLLNKYPDSIPLLRAHLRLLHAISVADGSYQVEGVRAIPTLTEKLKEPERKSLEAAYEGAFHIVTAKHAFWPSRKMDEVKIGLPLLDSAVKWQPSHADIRYLRLTSCFYLPFFFGRKNSVKEDFQALARLLPERATELPPKAFLGISEFVLSKGQLNPQAEFLLKETRSKVLKEWENQKRGDPF